MRDIYIDAANMKRCTINLGRVGENNVYRLDFDLLHFLQQLKNAKHQMTLKSNLRKEVQK